MNRFGCFIISAALGLTCGDAFAVDSCTKITATGHPAYPVIAFRDGDNIAGAAPDDVAIFVAKGKEFPFKEQNDLIGKKGVTNEGESYGDEFDAFMKDKLDVTRTDGISESLKQLLAGKADYLIAGYHPGLAEAAKNGLKDQIVPLDQALLTAEMFVAFSKKSPCRSLAPGFGQGITERTTDGSFDKMLNEATTTWDNAQANKSCARKAE